MKKGTILSLALCVMVLANVHAQQTAGLFSQVLGAEKDTVKTVAAQIDGYEELSGWGLEYQAVDGGFGLGMNLIINHFVLTGSLQSLETNKYVTTNENWSIGVGYNYRNWLGKTFYIEGTAGVEYIHSTVEVKSGSETAEDSNGEFGLFINPRIGMKLFKYFDNWISLTAGYRWDFIKFKFDEDYINDYFTVGLSTTF